MYFLREDVCRTTVRHTYFNINYVPLFPAYVLDFNYCNLTDSYTFSIINIQNNIRNVISGVRGKK